jgi:hypothetical protein
MHQTRGLFPSKPAVFPTPFMHQTRGLFPSKPAVSSTPFVHQTRGLFPFKTSRFPHGFHGPYAWIISFKTSRFSPRISCTIRVDSILQNQPFHPTAFMHHTRGLYPRKPATSPTDIMHQTRGLFPQKTSHFTHVSDASNPWTFSPKNQPFHPRL